MCNCELVIRIEIIAMSGNLDENTKTYKRNQNESIFFVEYCLGLVIALFSFDRRPAWIGWSDLN